MKNQRVAYVIVGWNNKNLLKECIESIIQQTYKNKKIIYVDNNSSDGSVDFVKTHFPEVEVIKQNENVGFARGNNIGIKYALKDNEVQFVALLNTDARLAKNWTEVILGTAILKPRGAAFQTITLDYYKHSIIDSTHVYVSYSGQGTQGSWRRELLEGHDVATQKVFGCNAAAVVYSRAFIEEQPFDDFFDENMFMYLEDVDVAARATVMGWDNYVVAGSRAYHMGSASSSKNPGFSLYMTFRNNSGVLVKNFHFLILLRMAPKILRGDFDSAIVLWRDKKKGLILQLLRGRITGLARLPVFLLKRRKVVNKGSLPYHLVWIMMRRGF